MEFGGSLLLNKRKSKRTLTTKKPIHMILKGDINISGSLLKYEKWIDKEIKYWAEKFFIKIAKDYPQEQKCFGKLAVVLLH